MTFGWQEDDRERKHHRLWKKDTFFETEIFYWYRLNETEVEDSSSSPQKCTSSAATPEAEKNPFHTFSQYYYYYYFFLWLSTSEENRVSIPSENLMSCFRKKKKKDRWGNLARWEKVSLDRLDRTDRGGRGELVSQEMQKRFVSGEKWNLYQTCILSLNASRALDCRSSGAADWKGEFFRG